MASTVIDSRFLKDLYGTPEMRGVFADMRLLQLWLDVEVALARAGAEFGLIPAYAADEIARCARAEALDVERIKRGIDETVHPIVPVVRVLQEACAGDAGEYIHWGATTQDIMDTAMVLQVQEALPILEGHLAELIDGLVVLATRYRDTPMAGRTHGQQALPITFGFKVAVWLAEFQRHRERLQQCRPRVLVGQFGGAVGTLASVGEHGLQIQQRMFELLGLGVPLIAWHTARDGFAELAGVLTMLATSAGKITREIISLQKTEIAEVEELFHPGKVGSSTMPHKRNPMLCEAVVAIAKLAGRLSPSALDAMQQEHERDWAADHVEWAYLPELCILTDGALHLTARVVNGLRVYPERMARNLHHLDGLMLSEAVMLALGRHIGRQMAHELIYACSMQAVEAGRPFRETLAENASVTQYLSTADIDRLLDPAAYTGLAAEFVDRVLLQIQQ
jgi:adenylosuccinate lyase